MYKFTINKFWRYRATDKNSGRTSANGKKKTCYKIEVHTYSTDFEFEYKSIVVVKRHQFVDVLITQDFLINKIG